MRPLPFRYRSLPVYYLLITLGNIMPHYVNWYIQRDLSVFLSLTSLYLLTVGVECPCCTWWHSHTHTLFLSFRRTPLEEGSACRRGRYLTTHNTQYRKISRFCEIRTRNPNNRTAAYLSLRPRSHRDRCQDLLIKSYKIKSTGKKYLSIVECYAVSLGE